MPPLSYWKCVTCNRELTETERINLEIDEQVFHYDHFIPKRSIVGLWPVREQKDRIAEAASPDSETVTNEKGAKQSKVGARFDLIDGPAIFEMAAVLHTGAEKYGVDNWRGIDVDSHLNHLIMHAYAYLSGNRDDDHLSHVMCRAMFAQAVALTDEQLAAACQRFHPGEACLPGANHPAENPHNHTVYVRE